MADQNTEDLVTGELTDRLATLLDDPALEEYAPLYLDELQGYLCAALTGPSPMSEEQWLPIILGSEAALGTEVGRAAADVLRSFVQALNKVLLSNEPVPFLFYPNEDDPSSNDYASWCGAYLRAVDESKVDWFEALGIERDSPDEPENANAEADFLDERLFPLIVLTGAAEAAALEHGENWPTGADLELLKQECTDNLGSAIIDIHRFWTAFHSKTTIRHEQKKGRNDLCACGSGKKYKHCCAAD